MVLSDRPRNRTEPPRPSTLLGHLLDSLGPSTLRLLTVAADRERPVRATLLHDPVEPLPSAPHTLLLTVGLIPDQAEAAALVGEAAGRGFCGIVIKRRGTDVEPLLAAATRASIAVVQAPDEVSWRHLDGLVLSILQPPGSVDDRMTGAGEELFALANATAAVIGGSVAIEDLDRRVLAYSSLPGQRIDDLRRQGILDRLVPALDRHLAQYGAVLAATGVVRFSAEEVETPRAAITIRAGDQPLGTIWAIEGVHGLDPPGEQALIDAGRLAALPMLRRKHDSELGTQGRENALRGALDGALDPREAAFRLALTPGRAVTLLGFAPDLAALDSPPMTIQLAAAIARYLSLFRSDVAVAATDRAAYVLVPRDDPADGDGDGSAAAVRLARETLSSLGPRISARIVVAISGRSTTPADLPDLRREVDDILRVLLSDPELPPLSRVQDVRARLVLAHLADTFERLPRLRDPAVDELVRHDQDHQTEFGRSLTAWLEATGDVTAAAQALGVHANTLRYRLRRIEDRFGLRLTDPDTRLTAWLQLRSRPLARS